VRFGLIHRLMTDALAALGVLAVVSTASLAPWTNALLLAGLAIAIAIPESWQGRAALRHFATIAPLVLLLVQGARLLVGHSPLDVAVEFAALLQIVRLATRRGAAHDQQVIVLSLLHFVAGTVLGGGLTYGLCFLGFLVVAPGALVLSHLRREVEGNYRQGARDRTGLPVDVPRILRSRRVVGRAFLSSTCLLSVPILLFTTALFVLFPRIGLSLLLLNHPRAGRMIGFSEHVDLGEVGVLRDDPTIALRFEVKGLADPPPMRLTLRLRGTAFDFYDGRAWARTPRDLPREAKTAADFTDIVGLSRSRPVDPVHDRVVSFDLEPIDPPVVFLPPHAIGVKPKAPAQFLLGEPLAIQTGAEDEVRYTGSDARGLRYDVYLAADAELIGQPLSAAERARHLTLPSLPERVAELAHRWTDDLPTPEAKAAAIEDHLRREYTYDLHSSSQGKPQPVDHFLFESKKGHCEFFSTAMAVMLRMVGIPSRNVTGFVGGTWNRFGHYYAVRQGDAHSWVEAYIDEPGRGAWRTFDPTPPSGAQPLEPPGGAYYYMRDLIEAASQRWNTYVVGYDLRKQVRLFDEFNRRISRIRNTEKGPMLFLSKTPMTGWLVVLLLLLAFVAWRRYQRRDGALRPRDDKAPLDRGLETAAALYRDLETALQSHGMTRPAATPPLRYANELGARRHPLAPEVESLTNMYLEVRFGGSMLTPEARRDFERRVREIRAYRGDEARPAP
jgi:transglutaminase-like putative cysteine protease